MRAFVYTLPLSQDLGFAMDIAENNLVRFISITKKKDGMFANFRVKGMKGGATFSSSISVDINQTKVDASEPLEKIIAECGRIAVKMSETKLQFEGIANV
jgi:hypothetical protein